MTISQMAQVNKSVNSMGSYSGITNGYGAAESAKLENEMSTFQRMLENLTTKEVSSSNTRLNGDFTSTFELNNTTLADKAARPQGFAANSASASSVKGNIDRTSKLYEKSLELESYFVKMMLSSMRETVHKSGLNGDDSYASKMYEDMMYDELAVTMTKNAGFGLADQIYLSLATE